MDKEKYKTVNLKEPVWYKLSKFKVHVKAKDWSSFIHAFYKLVRHLKLENEYKEQLERLG